MSGVPPRGGPGCLDWNGPCDDCAPSRNNLLQDEASKENRAISNEMKVDTRHLAGTPERPGWSHAVPTGRWDLRACFPRVSPWAIFIRSLWERVRGLVGVRDIPGPQMRGAGGTRPQAHDPFRQKSGEIEQWKTVASVKALETPALRATEAQ